MKSFFRVVGLSLRYRWSIAGAVLCSLLIAVLWSASITTIYPFIQIVFQGQTVHTWLSDKMAGAEQSIEALEGEIDELEAERAAAEPAAARTLANQISLKADRLRAEQRWLDWYRRIEPSVDRYAPQTPFATLGIVLGWLLLTTVLKGGLLIVSCYLVARIANRTVMDLRRIYYRKALDMDQRRIDQLGTSNLMTHLSHNMLMISGGLTMFYGKSLREPLKMISCLAVAAWISWPLLLISLLVLPPGGWVVRRLALAMKRATQREVDGMSAIFQTLMETFSSIKTVRIFNRERSERQRFKRNAASLYRMSVRMSFYDALVRPITEMLGIASIALSIFAGAYLVLHRETHLFNIRISDVPLEASMLIMFYGMLAGMSDPARKMSEILNVLVRGGTACENLFRTFDVEPTITAPADRQAAPVHDRTIQFEHVSFAYYPRQPVLRDINLEVPFGQAVAIVGGNGSGKTTLINLLARFYDPGEGHIRIDGVDLRAMSPKAVRRHMSWVTQDATLFRGTVRENIAYGKPRATEAEILAAAEMAHVADFLDRLPHGLESDVGDNGQRLSAGQRQRVALARAVVANPRILILDEATSQMDGHTETLIHDSLKEFLAGRTTILITHRLSSLRLADRVIVLDKGRIVSDSTPTVAAGQSAEFQSLFAKSA